MNLINFKVVLLLAVFLKAGLTISVRQRFYGGQPAIHPCRVLQPNWGVLDLKNPIDQLTRELSKLALDYVEPLNCSIDFESVNDRLSIGKISANGSYDGI